MTGASAENENGIQHPDGEERSPIGGEERSPIDDRASTTAQGHRASTGPRTPSASERVRDANFPVAMRGYDRRVVDEYVAELTELVDDLEGRQLREKVVQRALDEVGEQTAGILQQAHETADELSARSRAQAEGRLQRAEREAELAKTEADRYAEQVALEIRRLWEERNQLIEDVRRLADEVLATADEAAERLKIPEAVAAALPATAETAPGDAQTVPLPPTPLRSVESPQPAPVAGEDVATRVRCAARSPIGLRYLPRAGSLPRAFRPDDALLFVALREVPKVLEKRRPIGPGARLPALCPTPSVLSTPRCGCRERRGTRKPSTRRITHTAMMIPIVMADHYPGLAAPKTGVRGAA